MPLARILAFLLVFLTVVGGACSDGEGAAKAVETGATKPCSLVQKPDVEATAGRFLDDGTQWSGLPDLVGEEACHFRPAGSDVAAPPLVKVGVVSAYASIVFNRYKTQHEQAMPVPNLGNEALWDDSTRTLVVLKEDTVVTVVLYGRRASDHRQRAINLAKKVIGRI